MAQVSQAAYKVFSGADSGEFIGTAFAISKRHIITCHHVLDGEDCASVAVQSSVSEGQICAIEWTHFDKRGFDFSLGCLPATVSDRMHWLAPVPVAPEQYEQPLSVYGFGSATEGLDVWTDNVSGSDHAYGLVKLQNTTRKGTSGGPVLDNRHRAIGIMVARREDGAQKYVLPFASVFGLLERDGIRAGEEGLLAVPVGPMLRSSQIPTEIVEAFASSHSDLVSAKLLINRAMHLARSNNPEAFTEKQIEVLPIEYPTFQAPQQFWFEIFEIAGKKSRRCVAALLDAEGAPDPRLLDRPLATKFEDFWTFLKNP